MIRIHSTIQIDFVTKKMHGFYKESCRHLPEANTGYVQEKMEKKPLLRPYILYNLSKRHLFLGEKIMTYLTNDHYLESTTFPFFIDAYDVNHLISEHAHEFVELVYV